MTRRRRVIGLVVAPLFLHVRPSASLFAQAHRATLQLEWKADSSWEGQYYQKPHRFRIHEELAGRLVFDLADSSRVIQIRDDGTVTGAMLVEAVGTSAYSSDMRKEGGDCATPGSPTAQRVDAPFVGREEANAVWDTRAPGPALIILKGGVPLGVAFSPKPMRVESTHRLLCPQPEMVRRWQSYRITVRSGGLLKRTKTEPDSGDAAGGHWTIESGRTPRGGYTSTATYAFVVRQRNPVFDDPSASTGRLEVTKTLLITWEMDTR